MRIITRDYRILTRRREIEAVRSACAAVFTIRVEDAKAARTWDLLEVLVTRWRDMSNYADEHAGPYVVQLTRSGIRKIGID